ncbi:MAG TPA: response regulator transcription factor [Chitinophagaceae bacterium]
MKTVALVDDHILLRHGLAALINSFPGYSVLFEADNGKQLTEMINPEQLPTAILLDINMPEMNGFEAAAWMKKTYPDVKILALSMRDEEDAIIRMLHAGANGYVLKNASPQELLTALDSLISRGFYLNDQLHMTVIQSVGRTPAKEFDTRILTPKELQFIHLSCSDLGYAAIAREMGLSPKTIDFYKQSIEKKIGIRNRVSLVMFAIRNGIVKN